MTRTSVATDRCFLSFDNDGLRAVVILFLSLLDVSYPCAFVPFVVHSSIPCLIQPWQRCGRKRLCPIEFALSTNTERCTVYPSRILTDSGRWPPNA